MQNCIYTKSEMKHQIDGYTNFHKRRNDGYESVESTIVLASKRRLDKRRIDNCSSVDGYIDYFISFVERNIKFLVDLFTRGEERTNAFFHQKNTLF